MTNLWEKRPESSLSRGLANNYFALELGLTMQ